MVGAALEVASSRLDKIELINRLNGTTKSVLKYKAPAKALYLEKVEYDFKRCENERIGEIYVFDNITNDCSNQVSNLRCKTL